MKVRASHELRMAKGLEPSPLLCGREITRKTIIVGGIRGEPSCGTCERAKAAEERRSLAREVERLKLKTSPQWAAQDAADEKRSGR